MDKRRRNSFTNSKPVGTGVLWSSETAFTKPVGVTITGFSAGGDFPTGRSRFVERDTVATGSLNLASTLGIVKASSIAFATASKARAFSRNAIEYAGKFVNSIGFVNV
jgi:hypothetical protein